MTKFVCLSDTHNQADKLVLPEGDILIHTGDFSNRGTEKETQKFIDWMDSKSDAYEAIVFISGNHDFLAQKDGKLFNSILEKRKAHNIIYLQDQSIQIAGLTFFGSPMTPRFCDWAFNADEEELIETWAQIPEDVDVLLTHGPPYGILDEIPPTYCGEEEDKGEARHVGCKDLKARLDHLKQLKLHVFGHIHYSYGTKILNGYTTFVNAASCNESYRPLNPPIVIEVT